MRTDCYSESGTRSLLFTYLYILQFPPTCLSSYPAASSILSLYASRSLLLGSSSSSLSPLATACIFQLIFLSWRAKPSWSSSPRALCPAVSFDHGLWKCLKSITHRLQWLAEIALRSAAALWSSGALILLDRRKRCEKYSRHNLSQSGTF